jgi:hypothetical protein
MVDKNATHDASGHREKVRAVVPRNVLGVDQSQIRLIDERCRLEAVARSLATQVPARDRMELTVDERNQSFESGLVALPPLEKELRNLIGNIGDDSF